jgi:hypothetical protein
MTPEEKDLMLRMYRDLGYIRGVVESMREKLSGLPCIQHGEDIRELKARAGLWGAACGAAVSIIGALAAWMVRG